MWIAAGSSLRAAVEHVREQRPARERLEHLRQRRVHSFALARGENDDSHRHRSEPQEASSRAGMIARRERQDLLTASRNRRSGRRALQAAAGATKTGTLMHRFGRECRAASTARGEIHMARITRRSLIQASAALAAAPALTAGTARAQPPAPDIGKLRAEKDIVFGKGGDIDLMLDVYHPPEGVTPKRMAIIHLVRRRLLRRQQERRLHHQRRQGARRPRLHERLRELSAAEPRPRGRRRSTT